MIGFYHWTRPLSLVIGVLGIVIFVIGAIHGGTAGMLIGVLFFVAGAGRLWLMRKRDG